MAVTFIDKKTKVCIPKVNDLIVDKLSLTVSVPEQLKSITEQKFLNNFLNDNAKQVHGTYTSRYKYAGKAYCNPLSCDYLLAQYGAKDSALRDCRIEYNPSKLSPYDIKSCIDGFYPGGFESLIEKAIVTRIDLAVDLEGVAVHNLLFNIPGIQTSKNILKAGKIQTAYLGVPESEKQYIFYDKIARMKHSNSKKASYLAEPIPKGPITRCELKFRPKGLKFLGLYTADNMFSQLRMTAYNSEDFYGGDIAWRCFMANCQDRGLQQALKLIPTQYEKIKFEKKVIGKGFNSWWKPETTWASLPSALSQVILPLLEVNKSTANYIQ